LIDKSGGGLGPGLSRILVQIEGGAPATWAAAWDVPNLVLVAVSEVSAEVTTPSSSMKATCGSFGNSLACASDMLAEKPLSTCS